MRRFLSTTAMVLAIMTVASCGLDYTMTENTINTEISIRTDKAMTRSAINGTAFPQGYDIMVSAFRNLGNNPGEDSAQDYFEGIRFGYDSGTGSWKSEMGAKYYPLDGTLDFLALAGAGFNNGSTGIVPTLVWGTSGNVAKRVVATVPDNSAKFDDLMYGASNGCGLSVSGSGITFKHAMTSVVFLAKCNMAYNAVTNVGITIDGITVDGAKHSGTLTVNNPSAGGGSGELNASWSSLGTTVANAAARVWNAANLGTNTSEPALSSLNLGTASKSLASYPFGEGYVILPPQDAVPFTVQYTIHNGMAADGTTPLNRQVQTIITPEGSWAMGKKNVYEIEFNLNEIKINPSVVDWDVVENDLIKVPEEIFTFAGLQIAPGNLFYNGESYEIADSWNHDSYGSKRGKVAGSYYFNEVNIGELFDSPSYNMDSDGDIQNNLDPLEGWRLPTKTEWEYILTTDSEIREGSTVNGSENKHYAFLKLTDVSHAGNATPVGLLIFPDEKNITGKALSGMDDDTYTEGVTEEELATYIEQGCAFLPPSGMYMADYKDWSTGGNYLTSTVTFDESYCTDLINYLNFRSSSTGYTFTFMAYIGWEMSVRLVKPI